MEENLFWTEKYRPKTIDEVILPESMKQQFRAMVKSGKVPNLLLSGGPGIGKTTIAKALCNELGYDVLYINASMHRNIDTLRYEIQSFASTVSMDGSRKCVILDEADHLNPTSTQPALRAFMEEFSSNCSFILTCNFPAKIIPPLHSRLSVTNFKMTKDERKEVAKEYIKRLISILKEENVEFETAVLVELVKKYFPDFRKVLNDCQKYAVSGKIDSGIFTNLMVEAFQTLLPIMKAKDFDKMRKWVVENVDIEPADIFRMFYDVLDEHIKTNKRGPVLYMINEYQKSSAIVVDQEINTSTFLMEVMGEDAFK